jgi:hypothetical protein
VKDPRFDSQHLKEVKKKKKERKKEKGRKEGRKRKRWNGDFSPKLSFLYIMQFILLIFCLVDVIPVYVPRLGSMMCYSKIWYLST